MKRPRRLPLGTGAKRTAPEKVDGPECETRSIPKVTSSRSPTISSLKDQAWFLVRRRAGSLRPLELAELVGALPPTLLYKLLISDSTHPNRTTAYWGARHIAALEDCGLLAPRLNNCGHYCCHWLNSFFDRQWRRLTDELLVGCPSLSLLQITAGNLTILTPPPTTKTTTTKTTTITTTTTTTTSSSSSSSPSPISSLLPPPSSMTPRTLYELTRAQVAEQLKEWGERMRADYQTDQRGGRTAKFVGNIIPSSINNQGKRTKIGNLDNDNPSWLMIRPGDGQLMKKVKRECLGGRLYHKPAQHQSKTGSQKLFLPRR